MSMETDKIVACFPDLTQVCPINRASGQKHAYTAVSQTYGDVVVKVVCPFNNNPRLVREIQIMRGSRTIRHWPLSCHDGDYCTDEIDASPAIAVNPEWMLDQYITWDRMLTREYHGEPSLAYDNEGGLFITTDGRWMECINVENASVSVIDNIGGRAPINAPDQLLYTGEDIFSYNVDDALYARFNKQGRRWEGADVFTPESHYWNKASVWWEGEKALVSFGGYGFYHYNNELMIQYPYSDKEDVKVVLEGIHPRYSAATAILGDTLYIFGGRGNPSGKQELYEAIVNMYC